MTMPTTTHVSRAEIRNAMALKKKADARIKKLQLKPHPAANVFPMMSEAEYSALKEDISNNGQREPIIVQDGLIIDGRNRYRACRELGIEPRTAALPKDASPASYAVSSNMMRRNLNDGQKACAAVRILPILEAEARTRQLSGLKTKTKLESDNKGKSSEQAARLFGCSGRYVEMAKKLFAEDSRLFDGAFRGRIALSRAHAEAFKRTTPSKGVRIVVTDIRTGGSTCRTIHNTTATAVRKQIAAMF